MSKQTMQERFAAALEARGERKVKSTFRYEVFSRAKGGFYYLGRAGALRVGPTVADSFPVGDAFRKSLLEEGEGR